MSSAGPINYATQAERRQAVRAAAPDCVKRIKKLNPGGVIVCHAPTFEALRLHLEQECPGLLLQDKALPFPIGNTRAEFVKGVRNALGSLPRGM